MSRLVIEMKWFSKKRLKEKIAGCLRIAHTCAAFLFSLMLTNGCSWIAGPIDAPEHLAERSPRVQQMPDQQETVRGDKDPPVVKLQLGKTLRPANLRPSDELPSRVKIGATNLNNVPVTSALQAVLADTDITLLWGSEELQDRKVTLLNLKGSLPVVVNRICRAAKVLCAYRNGALELAEEDTFVVELPGIASAGSGSSSGGGVSSSASTTIADSISSLIDGKVKADTVGGNLIYTTNAEGHERVLGYLDQLRNGRPLIVMQLYIWQVTLDNEKKMGINWKDFRLPNIGPNVANVNLSSPSSLASSAMSNFTPVGVTDGVSLGAVLSCVVDVNVIAGFLATQGKVQTISSPQLTFVSGTSARFEVGDSERYVSQVGTLTNSTVAGTGSTNNANNNTVNTEELKTGLAITVNGNYENGVIFSNLEIKTSDFIKFTSVPTGSTALQLPKTANRSVQTVLLVRPGDNLVLAGLQTSREDRTHQGLPIPDLVGGMIPAYADGITHNDELVVMVKPSVVFFSDKDAVSAQNAEMIQSTADSAMKPSVAVREPDPVVVVPTPVKMVETPISVQPVKPSSELQGEFGNAVKEFEATHDKLPPKSNNAIPQPLVPNEDEL